MVNSVRSCPSLRSLSADAASLQCIEQAPREIQIISSNLPPARYLWDTYGTEQDIWRNLNFKDIRIKTGLDDAKTSIHPLCRLIFKYYLYHNAQYFHRPSFKVTGVVNPVCVIFIDLTKENFGNLKMRMEKFYRDRGAVYEDGQTFLPQEFLELSFMDNPIGPPQKIPLYVLNNLQFLGHPEDPKPWGSHNAQIIPGQLHKFYDKWLIKEGDQQKCDISNFKANLIVKLSLLKVWESKYKNPLSAEKKLELSEGLELMKTRSTEFVLSKLHGSKIFHDLEGHNYLRWKIKYRTDLNKTEEEFEKEIGLLEILTRLQVLQTIHASWESDYKENLNNSQEKDELLGRFKILQSFINYG